MRAIREWAAVFLAASATVETVQRQVGCRSKITWKKLPVRRGTPVLMSADHGHAYQALVAHTSNADHDADSIQSDASIDQIAKQSFFSPSKVEGLLSDLKAVGFISVTRRFNKSNLTTIYKEPGHFGVEAKDARNAEADRLADTVDHGRRAQACTANLDSELVSAKPSALEEFLSPAAATIDVAEIPAALPDLAKQTQRSSSAAALPDRIAAALDDAGCPFDDLDFEDTKAEISRLYRSWEAHTLFNRDGMQPHVKLMTGGDDQHFALIRELLPKNRTLGVFSWHNDGSAWAITKRPEVIARALLAEACGREIPFGGFGKDTKDHPALPIFLAGKIREDSADYGHVWRGIAAALNPAAYLQAAVAQLLEKYDRALLNGSVNFDPELCEDREERIAAAVSRKIGGREPILAYEEHPDWSDEDDSDPCDIKELLIAKKYCDDL